MNFSPANSGVVIQPETWPPTPAYVPDMLCSGRVLARGGGVPWLSDGDRVVFRVGDAFTVPQMRSQHERDNGPWLDPVVVHQREVLGVIGADRHPL